jgi:hypothetical protein
MHAENSGHYSASITTPCPEAGPVAETDPVPEANGGAWAAAVLRRAVYAGEAGEARGAGVDPKIVLV